MQISLLAVFFFFLQIHLMLEFLVLKCSTILETAVVIFVGLPKCFVCQKRINLWKQSHDPEQLSKPI